MKKSLSRTPLRPQRMFGTPNRPRSRGLRFIIAVPAVRPICGDWWRPKRSAVDRGADPSARFRPIDRYFLSCNAGWNSRRNHGDRQSGAKKCGLFAARMCVERRIASPNESRRFVPQTTRRCHRDCESGRTSPAEKRFNERKSENPNPMLGHHHQQAPVLPGATIGMVERRSTRTDVRDRGVRMGFTGSAVLRQ